MICSLYSDHGSAPCVMIDTHHVLPLSWGTISPEETVEVCPNCHYNIHVAIDAHIHGVPVHVPPRCAALAARAFVLAEEHDLTPKLTL